MDYRTLLAAALGVGLGMLLIVAPEAIVRAHTTGRVPGERGGEYGTDSVPDDRVRLLVRVVGVGLVAAGLYFGATGFGML